MVDFDNPLDDQLLGDIYTAKREVFGDDLTRPMSFIIGRFNADGSVDTEVTDGEYNRIWASRPGEDSGDAVQVINTTLQKHEITENRPIMVKLRNGKFIVDDKAAESADYDAQLPTAPQKPINRPQYNLALITPTMPDTSFYASYRGGIFQLNSIAFRITDSDSGYLEGDVPVANALSIKVEIDPVAGTWHETVGSAFTFSTMEAALKNGDLDTTRTMGRFLIGWIRLYDGQSAIELDDILPAEHMLDLYEGAKFANGFVKDPDSAPPTDSTISYDPATRTIGIAPTGDSFIYWLAGIPYTVTSNQELIHADVTGTYFFYWNSSNVLTLSTTPWSIVEDVPISYVYYNATLVDGIKYEERHGADRALHWHYSDHYKRGTFWHEGEGLGIGDYTLQPGAPADSDNQWSIASGEIHDEDIAFQVTGRTTGTYEIFSRDGATGVWTWLQNNVPLLAASSYLYWNQFTGGAWQQTAAANNNYVNYYIMTTPSLDADFDVFVIMGQEVHSTLIAAQGESISDLDFGTLPFQEILSIYQVTFRTSAAYGTEGKCRIEAVADTRETTGAQVISGTPGNSHPSLSGLTWTGSGHVDTASQLAGFDAGGLAETVAPAGVDTTAIHNNVAGEIAAIALKGTPINNDIILIEDSADSNNKKRITVGSLPGGSAPALFRSGLELHKIADGILGVGVGSATVAGTLVDKTSATSVNLATAGNWIGGSSTEAASIWIHVYLEDDGTILLHDEHPYLPTSAAVIADMQVNEATYDGTAGTGLNATSVVYDNDTGEGSVAAGMWALFYSDAALTTGRGKGSAAAAAITELAIAKITAIDTGTNTLTLEAGHNIAINDDDYIAIVDTQQLIYRDVGGTDYLYLGAWPNDGSSNLYDINNQYGLNKQLHAASYTANEGSDYTTTTTSFTPLDATNFSLEIVTTGGDIEVDFDCYIRNTTGITFFNLTVDGAVYLGEDGITRTAASSQTNAHNVAFTRLISGLQAGTHTVVLTWKVSAGTTTLYAGAGTGTADIHPQLVVREVG